MKAVVYEGPRKVAVKEMPDARIEKPTDALIKITTTNICGSDLHIYEGRTLWKRAGFSAMRISASSSRSARASSASRWATACACLSTSPVVAVQTVSAA